MIRLVCLAQVFAFFAGTAAAQQPRIIEIQQPFSTRILEESAEQLEAALDVKKAYVKAAEVALAATKWRYEQIPDAAKEKEEAKFGLEAAVAQLDVRKAEAREVEVRLKQVKKRLEESKPGAAPKAKEPSPASPDILEAAVKIAKFRVEKAKLTQAEASEKLAYIKRLAEKGIVAQSDITGAQAAVLTADLDLQIAKTELEIAQTKLKEFKEKK